MMCIAANTTARMVIPLCRTALLNLSRKPAGTFSIASVIVLLFFMVLFLLMFWLVDASDVQFLGLFEVTHPGCNQLDQNRTLLKPTLVTLLLELVSESRWKVSDENLISTE
jgi:hypothetical protein